MHQNTLFSRKGKSKKNSGEGHNLLLDSFSGREGTPLSTPHPLTAPSYTLILVKPLHVCVRVCNCTYKTDQESVFCDTVLTGCSLYLRVGVSVFRLIVTITSGFFCYVTTSCLSAEQTLSRHGVPGERFVILLVVFLLNVKRCSCFFIMPIAT